MTLAITRVEASPRLGWFERLRHFFGRHAEHRHEDFIDFYGGKWWILGHPTLTTRRVRHCLLCEPYLYHETITLDGAATNLADDDIVYRSRADDGLGQMMFLCFHCGLVLPDNGALCKCLAPDAVAFK